MCFDPISAALVVGGSALSAGGTKMQNDANNKAQRINAYNAEIARQLTAAELKDVNEKNRSIDYENNARQNADIDAAEALQFKALQQDAADARLRNQVLAEFTARQQQAAADNAATIAAGAKAQGAEGTEATRQGAAASRTAAAESAIAAGGETDAGFRGSTPGFIQGALAKALTGARASASQNAAAGAQVAAYGDAFGRQEMGIGDIASKIALRNNFAKGDLSLLPAEQELRGMSVRTPLYAKPTTLLSERWAAPTPIQPNVVQPKTSETGALLKGLGSLMGSLGGSGKGKDIGSMVSGWFS